MEPQEITAPVLPEPREEGSRMKMLKRVLLGLVPVALLVLGGAGVLLYSPESEVRPSVAWAPPSISLVVGAGQSTAVEATFIPSENASDVTVGVVPELATYVSVSPASFASVVKGVAYPVTVTASASSTAPLGLHEGTLHLKQGKKTLAKPLPIGVEVVWPTFLGAENLGFALQYPPGWVVSPDASGVRFSNSEVPITFSDYAYFTVERDVNANPDALPISEWLSTVFSRGFPSPITGQPVTIAGRDAVRIEWFNVRTEAALFIDDSPDVIRVSYGIDNPGFVPDCEAILQSVSFSE